MHIFLWCQWRFRRVAPRGSAAGGATRIKEALYSIQYSGVVIIIYKKKNIIEEVDNSLPCIYIRIMRLHLIYTYCLKAFPQCTISELGIDNGNSFKKNGFYLLFEMSSTKVYIYIYTYYYIHPDSMCPPNLHNNHSYSCSFLSKDQCLTRPSFIFQYMPNRGGGL